MYTSFYVFACKTSLNILKSFTVTLSVTNQSINNVAHGKKCVNSFRILFLRLLTLLSEYILSFNSGRQIIPDNQTSQGWVGLNSRPTLSDLLNPAAATQVKAYCLIKRLGHKASTKQVSLN